MDVGPRRNVLKELKDAFSARHPDFHFGIYYSLFEWFNPMYLKDKANNFTTRSVKSIAVAFLTSNETTFFREYVLNKMLPEMKQLAMLVEPHVWWSDGDWEATDDYFGSKDFLAWLYNESPSKDYVVTNDRWGKGTSQKHGGYYSGPDRYQPGHLLPHKWESAMTVDSQSWGLRRNIKIDDVLTPEELISQVNSECFSITQDCTRDLDHYFMFRLQSTLVLEETSLLMLDPPPKEQSSQCLKNA